MFFAKQPGFARHLFMPTALLATFLFSACSAQNSLPNTQAVTSSTAVSLASASSTDCVNASTSNQSVALPDTAGVNVTLNFAKYNSGASSCQNITVATGASAVAAASTASRQIKSASSNPLMSVTLGQALANNTNLTLTTVLSGATIKTDSNVVFPNGTYNATITVVELGTTITYSVVFTATNGQLTVTGGTALPLTLGQGAVINIYDRGIVPPNFDETIPTPTPTINPNATPTPVSTATSSPSSSPSSTPLATATPTLGPGQPVADGTQVGTYGMIVSGLPNNLYGNGVTTTGTLIYQALGGSTPCVQDQTTGNLTCTATGSSYSAGLEPGVTTYTLSANVLGAKSYRINGCTGLISYGGNGVSGTISVPYQTTGFAASDSCDVEIFSQLASVINANPSGSYPYLVYSLGGPVIQFGGSGYVYPAAINI